jgi:hypothetical protein
MQNCNKTTPSSIEHLSLDASISPFNKERSKIKLTLSACTASEFAALIVHWVGCARMGSEQYCTTIPITTKFDGVLQLRGVVN